MREGVCNPFQETIHNSEKGYWHDQVVILEAVKNKKIYMRKKIQETEE